MQISRFISRPSWYLNGLLVEVLHYKVLPATLYTRILARIYKLFFISAEKVKELIGAGMLKGPETVSLLSKLLSLGKNIVDWNS